ncbi:MAG: HD domain-containing protein [Ruminococcaceae bacterium]|nr:HD domain-containing protein [Oscillospiraceae bacterium]
MVSYAEIKKNPDITAYIEKADAALKAQGFTEHSFAHITRVAEGTEYILSTLDAEPHLIELGKIAAHLHDLGNVINRIDHSQSGALMAFRILDRLNMPAEDIATVIAAIGNHDEGTGVPIDSLSAALILADKSDVRRSRVRNHDIASFDIHDRVNYSVISSSLLINDARDTITLTLEVDTAYGSIMDYFEIFMQRMLLCRKAAEKLRLGFKLIINNQPLI